MLSFHLKVFVEYLTQIEYTRFDQSTDVLIYQGTISSGNVFVWTDEVYVILQTCPY